MPFFLIKILISATVIASVSEIGKRVSWVAAILASLPLISILSFVWLYVETKDIEKVVGLSKSVFWAVIPSLVFFIAFPICVRLNFNFYVSLGVSMVAMFLAYTAYIYFIGLFGIQV